jgi:hypothetical protein
MIEAILGRNREEVRQAYEAAVLNIICFIALKSISGKVREGGTDLMAQFGIFAGAPALDR